MSKTDYGELSRFVRYAQKMFHLNLLAGTFADSRPYPEIPGRAVSLTLLLGEVAHISSMLQLEKETELPQWQQFVGYPHPISDDTLDYVSERMDPGKLRRGAAWINRKLKRGKAFEDNKVNGLLAVSLDANEQFCSNHRCCADCLTREITTKDAQGQPVKHTQFYHKQVYAQLSGPKLSVILDVEAMRQGEEECAAALRLLTRLRASHGARFFDVLLVDAWYTNGPFLKAVVKMGWPVISVLKQERCDIYGEALALTKGQPPTETTERAGRKVEIWDLRQMTFTDSYTEPVRVVRVRESWKQRERTGGKWVLKDKEENWIWIVAGDLDGYGGAVIRDLGHLRWKIENNAFNQLTQGWRLTHCAHHHPIALQVLLWIKIIAFTLFHAYAILHGKLLRLSKVTFQELRKRVYRSLLCGEVQPFFSG
ncbi:MAG TPA: transposase [Pyrinomonadaceae bacterium]|nr:transposase [Pyrinomonadaceae bacterium]